MRALIIGAGVAGPVTAMALQRAGFDASVVEAHPRTDADVGSYFTVSPNGLDALAAIDALPVAQAIGFPHRRSVMRNGAGGILGEMTLGAPLADGTPALTMKRTRLARGLADEAERRGSGSPTVGGSSMRRGSGDGRRRQVRRRLDRDGRPPHRRGRRAFRRPAADRSRRAARSLRRAHELRRHHARGFRGRTGSRAETWQFVFGRHAFFGAQRAPNGDVIWFVNAPRPEIVQRGAGRDVVDGVAGDVGGAVRRRPLARRRAHPRGPSRACRRTTRTTSATCRSGIATG